LARFRVKVGRETVDIVQRQPDAGDNRLRSEENNQGDPPGFPLQTGSSVPGDGAVVRQSVHGPLHADRGRHQRIHVEGPEEADNSPMERQHRQKDFGQVERVGPNNIEHDRVRHVAKL